MVPLTLVKPGETGRIARVAGRDEVRRHLAEMGLVVGQSVTVVAKAGGNVILSVKGTRVALDGGMAGRIMV